MSWSGAQNPASPPYGPPEVVRPDDLNNCSLELWRMSQDTLTTSGHVVDSTLYVYLGGAEAAGSLLRFIPNAPCATGRE